MIIFSATGRFTRTDTLSPEAQALMQAMTDAVNEAQATIKAQAAQIADLQARVAALEP